MPKVLLDQGFALRAAELLRGRGWTAVHANEIWMGSVDDAAILQYAREQGMACVTSDHDFHAHLALGSSRSPSVVFVRLEGLGPEGQADLLLRVWAQCGREIQRGAAVTVEENRIRFRRLPLR